MVELGDGGVEICFRLPDSSKIGSGKGMKNVISIQGHSVNM